MPAMDRTILASQRTLLSYISSSVGFLAGGVGIIMYLENSILLAIGINLVIASVVILVLGVKNYWSMQELLSQAYKILKSSQGDLREVKPMISN